MLAAGEKLILKNQKTEENMSMKSLFLNKNYHKFYIQMSFAHILNELFYWVKQCTHLNLNLVRHIFPSNGKHQWFCFSFKDFI